MRGIIAACVLLLAHAHATAVDFRWTRGFAQGTSEATIRNAADSSVNIYCPSGQLEPVPGMFIESARIKPKPGEQIVVQIIVDGKNHPFYLQETQFHARGRMNYMSLGGLVNALAASKNRSFTVEFPKYGVAERFSLMDARRALGSDRSSILSGCSS